MFRNLIKFIVLLLENDHVFQAWFIAVCNRMDPKEAGDDQFFKE